MRTDAFWGPADPGVLQLPSGRRVRGRGLGKPIPPGHAPTFGVYLLGTGPPEFGRQLTARDGGVGWEFRWVRWPDFRLPADRADCRAALLEAWERAGSERVEIACRGGRGRTGTALACLAVLDGVPPPEAVGYVREHYSRHAVETPLQRRFVRTFDGGR